MCRRASCEVCEKVTYTGCGRHVEEVLGGLPESERCQCGDGGALSVAMSFAAPVLVSMPEAAIAA